MVYQAEALAADEGANGASSFERWCGSDGGSSGHDGDNTKFIVYSIKKKNPDKPDIPKDPFLLF